MSTEYLYTPEDVYIRCPNCRVRYDECDNTVSYVEFCSEHGEEKAG